MKVYLSYVSRLLDEEVASSLKKPLGFQSEKKMKCKFIQCNNAIQIKKRHQDIYL